jgi:PIN domain nuclease of toxin-antitoxin system
MDLILDTCGLLSLAGIADHPLTKDCLAKIQSADALYISACSCFEISLKHKRGQLDLGSFDKPKEFWEACLQTYELSEVTVSAEHFRVAVDLPDHHADPFDRIIIATAQAKGCDIVTYDKQFAKYDVATIR